MTRADLDAVFERAPLLLERLRPLVAAADGTRQIIAKARTVLAAMSEAERIAVLDAHPRIGADPALLSALSRREQGNAAAVATAKELSELNDAYERKFDFRFVVFVAGRTKAEIVPVLRERLARTRDEELRTGIDEFLAISLDRLQSAH